MILALLLALTASAEPRPKPKALQELRGLSEQLSGGAAVVHQPAQDRPALQRRRVTVKDKLEVDLGSMRVGADVKRRVVSVTVPF